MLENGRVAIPHSPTLNEECTALQWFTNPGGQIQILGKDMIRATLGRSPDTLDSLVMALATSMGAVRRNTFSVGEFEIVG